MLIIQKIVKAKGEVKIPCFFRANGLIKPSPQKENQERTLSRRDTKITQRKFIKILCMLGVFA